MKKVFGKKKLFGLYMKDIFSSPKVYLATAITVLVFQLPYLFGSYDFPDVIVAVFSAQGPFTGKLLYISAAFPFAITFCDDCRNQYIRFVVARSGVKKYIRAKFAAVFLSSFISVFVGILISTLIFSTKAPLGDYSTGGVSYGYFTLIGMPFFTIATMAFIMALFAAMYAVLALEVSAAIPNKFLTLVAPFALSTLFDEIGWAYLPSWLSTAHLSIAERAFYAPWSFDGTYDMTNTAVYHADALKNYLLNFSYTVLFALVVVYIAYKVYGLLVKKRIKGELNT